MRAPLWSLIVLVACSRVDTKDLPPTPTACGCDAIKSGSRLRVVRTVYEASDGTRLTTPTGRFFDRERKEQCALTDMTSGVARCLPLAQSGITGFVDAECTRPFVTRDETECTPLPKNTYLVFSQSRGGAPAEIVSVHSLVSGPTTARKDGFHFSSDGKCMPLAWVVAPGTISYEGGPPIAITTFAEATYSKETVTGCDCGLRSGDELAVRRTVYRGADGSRYTLQSGEFVGRDGAVCYPQLTTAGERCVPGMRLASFYLDAACSEPVLVTPPSPRPEDKPMLLATIERAMCGPGVTRYFKPTSPTPLTGKIYRRMNITVGSCAESPQPSGSTMMRLGGEVSPAGFVSLVSKTERLEESFDGDQLKLGSRLQRTVWRVHAEGGAQLAQSLGFYDRELDLDVNPDGGLMRPAAVRAESFADAACTKPIADVGACADGRLPKYVAVQAPPERCSPPSFKLYRLGVKFDGAVTHSRSEGTCVASTPTTSGSRYTTGDAVADAEFVTYKETEQVD